MQYDLSLSRVFLEPFSPMPVMIGLKLTQRRGLDSIFYSDKSLHSRAPPSWFGPPYHCHQNDIVRLAVLMSH